jgi:predicted ester cyclase
MSLEDNKNVVRRFITEILTRGDVSVVDQLVAPNYKNLLLPGQGKDAFKQLISMSHNAIPDTRYEIEDIVAEGDMVVVHFTFSGTSTGSIMGSKLTGKYFSVPGLVFYRLANGKIVEDAPFTSPDLMHLLGIPMPEQAQAQAQAQA